MYYLIYIVMYRTPHVNHSSRGRASSELLRVVVPYSISIPIKCHSIIPALYVPRV